MKGFVQATCMLAMLALCACTGTRAPKVADAEGQVPAPATTAEAPAITAEEAVAKSEQASTFFGRFFSRLFGGSGNKAADTAVAKEGAAATVTTKETVLPSPAQEEAALRMLAEQGSGANIPDPLLNGKQAGPLTMGLPDLESNVTNGMVTGALNPASGLRAAPGLRIRNMAPPEEAISADGNSDAPKPNSAELKGLRSLSLPETLPMDINGKLTKDQEKH